MQFSLRDFEVADFEQLWQLDQQCFPPGISYSRKELASYIRQRAAFTLIAQQVRPTDTHKPSILGFIVVYMLKGSGHVITIDVSPAARRSGIGSVLLQNAEQRLRAGNCSFVTLEAAVDNTGALAFYKCHGYSVQKIIPRYYSNGVDACSLSKELA